MRSRKCKPRRQAAPVLTTAGSTRLNKTTLQAIIVVVMSYERICSTARAVAASAGVAYVPHTLLQYQALIDRAAHAVYLTAVLAGPAPAYPDPFNEHFAEAVDDFFSARLTLLLRTNATTISTTR
jgi:hypothetical protein